MLPSPISEKRKIIHRIRPQTRKLREQKLPVNFRIEIEGTMQKKKLIVIIKKEKRSEPVIIYCMKGERRIFRDSHSFWGEGNGHRQRSRKGGTTRN